jgi:GcrA cell cycle regulator
MLHPHRLPWTEERSALASERWLAGCSASEIARELGGTTRNAVIGRLHRLGLSGRDTPTRKSVRTGAQTRRRRRRQPISEVEAIERQRRRAVAAISIERCDNQAGPDLLRPVHEMVKTVDLEQHHCRWVYGDGPFLHCGLTKTPGTPYCEFHAKRAYRPLQPTYHGTSVSRVGNAFFALNNIPLGTQSTSLKEFDAEPA